MNKFGLKVLFTLAFLILGVSARVGADISKEGVAPSAEEVCPIKIGQKIPDILVSTIAGKVVNLKKVIKKKPTLLIFYRGSWCPYCNTHLGELKTIESELKGLGYQIVAISPDLPENLQKSVDKNDLTYQLLSDSQVNAAKALGLAFQVDEKMDKKLKGYNIDLEKASGESHKVLPVPAALLLNKKGEVMFSFVSPDYKTRVDKRVLLAAAKSNIK